MTTTDTHPRRLSCAETAVELRGALKAAFPKTKFSVRSKTYSMGASIRVTWVDGPAKSKVDPICQRFAGASFDGMIDLKSYHDSDLVHANGTVERVSFGADFIFADREISDRDAKLAEATALIYANCGGITGTGDNARWGDRWLSDLARTTVYGQDQAEALPAAFRRLILREEAAS
jgi:hypothetical protein